MCSSDNRLHSAPPPDCRPAAAQQVPYKAKHAVAAALPRRHCSQCVRRQPPPQAAGIALAAGSRRAGLTHPRPHQTCPECRRSRPAGVPRPHRSWHPAAAQPPRRPQPAGAGCGSGSGGGGEGSGRVAGGQQEGEGEREVPKHIPAVHWHAGGSAAGGTSTSGPATGLLQPPHLGLPAALRRGRAARSCPASRPSLTAQAGCGARNGGQTLAGTAGTSGCPSRSMHTPVLRARRKRLGQGGR